MKPTMVRWCSQCGKLFHTGSLYRRLCYACSVKETRK